MPLSLSLPSTTFARVHPFWNQFSQAWVSDRNSRTLLLLLSFIAPCASWNQFSKLEQVALLYVPFLPPSFALPSPPFIFSLPYFLSFPPPFLFSFFASLIAYSRPFTPLYFHFLPSYHTQLIAAKNDLFHPTWQHLEVGDNSLLSSSLHGIQTWSIF